MSGSIKYLFIVLLVANLKNIFLAQNIDSLKLALKTAKHDTSRCKILNELAEAASEEEWPVYNKQLKDLTETNSAKAPTTLLKSFYLKFFANAVNNDGFLAQQQGNTEAALKYFENSLSIRQKIKDKSGIANSLNEIGTICENNGEINKALEFFTESLKILEEISDKQGLGYSLNNLGALYTELGDIPKALDYYHRALKMEEEINDKKTIALSLNNIAALYAEQDEAKALEFFYASLKIRKEIQDHSGIGVTLNHIGSIYQGQGDGYKALENFQSSLAIFQQIQNQEGMATSLNSLGNVYTSLGDFDKAIECFLKSLKIREQIQDKEGMAITLNDISLFYFRAQNMPEALNYASKSYQTAKKLGFPLNIESAAQTLKIIYQKQNKYKEAFEMYELEIKMRDSINNQETQKASLKKQMQYTYEKKELVMKAEQDKKDVIANEELKQKEKERNYFIAGFVLVIMLALFILRGYKQKQKDNALITQQKYLVEEKQREILDSIRYAKRIQTAVMTNEKYIEKSLNRLRTLCDETKK